MTRQSNQRTGTAEMKGRRVVITGATNGIGRVAAQRIAARGASLTVVGRNQQKTERVVDDIRRATGNDDVGYLLADLSSVAEVKRLASDVTSRLDRLDVLVNNAGAMFTRRRESPDGYEQTFALNHLGYFALTNELLPLLEEGERPRVVNVASDAHKNGKIHFDDLMIEQARYTPWRAYCQSKLANVLFTFELNRRLGDSEVTVNAMHPGFVRTGFGKNDGLFAKLLVGLGMVFARSPDKGAETVVWLATSPEVDGVSGKYWMDKSEHPSSRRARDATSAARLWERSEELVAAATEAR